jgi:glutathione S-transferase
MKAVLRQVPVSIFCEKGRWALDYKGIDYERKDFHSGLHPLLLRLTGRGSTVPALDLDGRKIGDTTAIVAALEEARPEPPLYPADAAERSEALELEDFFDEQCGHEIRRVSIDQLFADRQVAYDTFVHDSPAPIRLQFPLVFPLARRMTRSRYGIDAESVETARVKVMAAFDRLESQLGGGDYMVGGRFSVADLTAAALFAHLVLPPEYPYRMWDPAKVPRPLRDLHESLAARPGGQWVLEMYRRHRAPAHAGV